MQLRGYHNLHLLQATNQCIPILGSCEFTTYSHSACYLTASAHIVFAWETKTIVCTHFSFTDVIHSIVQNKFYNQNGSVHHRHTVCTLLDFPFMHYETRSQGCLGRLGQFKNILWVLSLTNCPGCSSPFIGNLHRANVTGAYFPQCGTISTCCSSHLWPLGVTIITLWKLRWESSELAMIVEHLDRQAY